MTDSLELDYVKNYLRVDYDEEQEDKFIQMCITASRSFVETYMNRSLSDFNEDSSYPAEIDIARLNVISQWYDTRTIMSPRSNVKEMEYVFAGLLDPHRYWNFAFIDGMQESGLGDLSNIFYDKSANRFYRAQQVDTYTALTGEDNTNVPNTGFYKPVNEVDYNQRGNR